MFLHWTSKTRKREEKKSKFAYSTCLHVHVHIQMNWENICERINAVDDLEFDLQVLGRLWIFYWKMPTDDDDDDD